MTPSDLVSLKPPAGVFNAASEISIFASTPTDTDGSGSFDPALVAGAVFAAYETIEIAASAKAQTPGAKNLLKRVEFMKRVS
jgi:hypothetical protein